MNDLRIVLIVAALEFVIVVHGQSCPSGWTAVSGTQNKCYQRISQSKSWLQAEQYCVGLSSGDSHLLSIHSSFENSAISGLSSSPYWIGANAIDSPGEYEWTDGTPFDYQNLVNSTTGSCVFMNSSRLWYKSACSLQAYFICEYIVSMTDCYDWKTKGNGTTSGVYSIRPPGTDPFNVYCDMTTDGGGWTVFQRRQSNSPSFYDYLWQDYKVGFSNSWTTMGTYWLGNERIYRLTEKDANVTLRIDLYGNQCPTNQCGAGYSSTDMWYGKWPGFRVGPEYTQYELSLGRMATEGNLSSSSYDLLYYGSNGGKFRARDNDTTNCVQYSNSNGSPRYCGGFWFTSGCGFVCLNGYYYPYQYGAYGFSYYQNALTNYYFINPQRSEMKLRRA